MKKIMFNDKYGLTQAVLDGHKTQTRRIINLDKIGVTNLDIALKHDWGNKTIKAIIENDAKYQVGEIVAVAQSYKDAGYTKGTYRDEETLIPIFRGDDIKNDIAVSPAGWTNKMFVKAELMPHQIRITGVRIERLQDISNEDCMKEGIRDYSTPRERRYGYSDFEVETIIAFSSHRKAYASLIDKISGKGTWDRNPFVFVYDFELVK